MNPLKLDRRARVVEPVAIPAGSRLEVELGCGEGSLLFERAARAPGGYFVGVEIRAELVAHVNRKAREQAPRVSAVCANVNCDLVCLFPAESVDRFYLTFPDPWFKRRHHKRRVLTGELLQVLYRQLKPGGEVYFESDVFELALDAMGVLEQPQGGFHNRLEEWSFSRDNPFGARSKRARQSERRGRRVWRLWYAKQSDGSKLSGP